MKYLRLSLLAFIIFSCFANVFSQSVTLETQADVDAFDPSITKIEGTLTIGTTNPSGISYITDLSNLKNIKQVERSLFIENLALLINLDGLSGIDSIGGRLIISSNDKLVNIDGLSELKIVDDIKIRDNELLLNVNGLGNLEFVGDLEINGNKNLEHLNGISHLDSISGTLSLIGLPKILNLNDLMNLQHVGGLSISNIQNLSGLINLETIDGDLRISNMNNLHNLDGLVNLKTIRHDIFIGSNLALQNVDGLVNVIGPVDEIEVNNNPQLRNINGLSGISSLTSWHLEITENPLLKNIDGLSGIDSIQGELRITFNDNLENVDGLVGLKYVRSDIVIGENKNLINLDGLRNLENFDLDIIIGINKRLKSIEGLSGLQGVFGGKIQVALCDSLQSLNGLSGIEKLKYLDIRGNKSLKNLDALINLKELNFLVISDNAVLNDISGLSNLSVVNNWIKVFKNPLLENCCGIQRALLNNPELNPTIDSNLIGCNNLEEVLNSSCDFSNLAISGKVFFDVNQNKIQDAFEYVLPNISLNYSQEDNTVLTDLSGTFFILGNVSESYTIFPMLEENWIITTDSSEYNITFEPGNPQNSNNNFGLYNTSETPSANVSITSAATRCNTQVEYYISVLNDGFVPRTGKLKITLDDDLGFISSSQAFMQDGQELTLELDSLYPFQSIDIEMIIDMPSEQFTEEEISVLGEVYYYNETGDIELQDQQDYRAIVLCSYDPNDKQVSPPGRNDEKYTLIEDELNYTVRFQNTGNAPAIDVRILDTLDANLDLNTFKVTQSSFPVITTLKENAIEFYFKDIWLVDSLTNEPESHGFINYTIRVKPDIQDFIPVENTAHIIFDFNPPIITNTTLNTMVEEYPVTSTKDEIKAIPTVYPNPTTGFLDIVTDKFVKVNLLNLEGELLIQSTESKVDIKELPEGVYLLQIFETDHSTLQKIVKM